MYCTVKNVVKKLQSVELASSSIKLKSSQSQNKTVKSNTAKRSGK